MLKLCLGCMQVYEGDSNVCPHCGYVEGTMAEEAIHMQPGTLLHGRYLVGRVLGYGGFGVTYIGYDQVLQQRVAIKEYLPGEFSTRVPGQTRVLVFEGEKSEQYRDGLKKFVEEARHLARFQNEEGIVKIFDSFEDNDTAYIIMEYLEGETLTAYMERNGIIDEDTAVEMLTPIMNSLQVVHEEGLLHRDIAPDNVFLTTDGEVKLIDFGASRYATTSHSRSLTVIIKPGYSPEEQYRSRGDQGPHTDVYALSATLYKMITGVTPPDALERRAMLESKSKDILVEPHKINKNISQVRENAILNALNCRIEDRTPTVGAFLEELNADKPAKRIIGGIRRTNLYRLPLWLKIGGPILLAGLLSFLILLITGVIDLTHKQEVFVPDGVVTVPDVEGEKSQQAISLIEGGKLQAVTAGNIESPYIEAGTIVYQTPMGGSYMLENGKVMLTVSSGQGAQEAENGIATVPYVIWSDLEDALEELKTAGLGEVTVEEEYDDSVAEGQVISMTPEPGEEVEEGSPVTLVISKGAKPFEMPDVVGMDKEKAEKLLSDNGLMVTISYVKDNSYPENEVLKQSIEKGEEVKRGTEVTIEVATKEDTIKVKDTVGKTKKEAQKLLEDQGFKVNVLENYDDKIEKGQVISQTPAAGSEQEEGTTVTIIVSLGKETKETEKEETKTTETSTTQAPTTTTQAPTTQAPTTAAPTTQAPTKPAAPVAVTGVTLSKTSVTLTVDDTTTLTANVTPSNAANKSVTWSSSDASVASVDGNGKVTAKKAGNATITVKTADGGKTASCKVTVNRKAVRVTGVKLNTGSLSITEGDTASLTATVSPDNADNKSVTWSSSNTSVATVSNGTVTGKSVGSATITVTTADGNKTATCTVTVIERKYPVTGVSLNTNSLSLVEGNSSTLTATVSPANASNKTVNWSSSNGNVATVDASGKVTGVNIGSAVITSTTSDGDFKATCNVSVTGAPHTLTFNANGGSVSESSRKVNHGDPYGNLPNATRDGFGFSGWFTEAGGGNQVDESTIMGTSDVTVYAHWNVNGYTVTWSQGAGTTIQVQRTSSPNAGAATGNLSNGAAVYYGDVLAISYAANTGYSLASKGATSITVTGNVTGNEIYATATANSYTYNVVYRSSNGTNLGSSTISGKFGTSTTVTAPGKGGYNTPGAQTVTFDSTSAKTITFTYAPIGVGTQTLGSGWWWDNGNGHGIKYTCTVSWSNRTSSSVTANITWTQTITNNTWYGYWQKFSVNIGNGGTGTVDIASNSTWAQGFTGSKTITKTKSFTVSGLSATQTSVSFSYTGSSYSGSANCGTHSGSVTIPTY